MQKDNYQIIIHFLDGKLSVKEKKALAKWRAAHPDNENQFQEIKFLWQKTKLANKIKTPLKIDVNAALANVHQQLPKTAKVIPLRKRLLQFSAVASVLLVMSLFVWMTFFQSVEIIQVATLANETKQITLPDQSTVWLNENSTLSYPKEFDASQREVTMNGDLVFEVTHNSLQPFMVTTNDLTVKVLGTKFNVQSSGTNSIPSIVHVLDGKVQVQKKKGPTNKVLLTKGMTALLDQDQLTLTESFFSNQLFWFTNTLSFESVTLEKVIQDINQAYQIDIALTNATVRSCLFTGTFKAKTSAAIIESLQLIYGFDVKEINSTTPQLNNGTCN